MCISNDKGGMDMTRLANQPMRDDPVTVAWRELPHGDGTWPGYDAVYDKISRAADKMSRARYILRSEIHVQTMAILGCGHEETMKAHVHWLMTYGWI